MLILGTTLAFLELATEEAALLTGLSPLSPPSALMRSAIWRHAAQSIVHRAFFGLNNDDRRTHPGPAGCARLGGAGIFSEEKRGENGVTRQTKLGALAEKQI